MDSSPSRFPAGVDLVESGECHRRSFNPMACMFCAYGHMLECHHPYTCEEVECSHYQAEMEQETYPPGEEVL